jgi:hypothetical protein
MAGCNAKARSCYQRAGLDAQWQALIAEIRREHRRKSSFMPGFERIVGGTRPGKEPSFLDSGARELGKQDEPDKSLTQPAIGRNQTRSKPE